MSDVEAALRLVLEVDTEEAKDLTSIQKSLLGDLMRQANECILFIREYSQQSYCMTCFSHCCVALSDLSLVKIVGNALIKNYNTIIAEYTRALHSLIGQFNNSALQDIQVVVHRLVSQVQSIGKHFHCLHFTLSERRF